MVTRMLRELAGPYPPFFPLDERWFHLYERIARQLTDAWDHVCRQAIQAGIAEELHASREDYEAVLLAHLKILNGYLALLSRFSDERPPERYVERLAGERDRLQQHHDSLFPRWQTLDDLEAILLERISLSNDRLKALAANHPPSPAWYEETNDRPTAQE